MDLESAFLADIAENPADSAPWLILADWLIDRGDLDRAELIQATLRLRESHNARDENNVRQLLARGVQPVVPRHVNSIGMALALIPAGDFFMGSPEDEAGRFDDEGPGRSVRIAKPFYIGVTAVTQAEFLAVMGENPAHFNETNKGGPNHPVESLTWFDAVQFCQRLSRRPEEAGRLYRLPTEAEWEYACRAGTTSAFHFGSSASSAEANFDGNHPYGGALRGAYLMRTTPAGQYRPNAFGLYDTHGNVREMCADWYGSLYFHDAPDIDPPGPTDGEGRVQRGGSWGSFSWGCRSAFRLSIEPDRAASVGGFRVVMTEM